MASRSQQIAVVPVPHPTQQLGERRRGGCDDATGGRVRQRLERDERPDEWLAETPRVRAGRDPVSPERLGVQQRLLGIHPLGRRAVRGVPRQHERHAVARADVELGHGVEVPAFELDRRREEEGVRACDCEQPVLAPADPGDDRAVVEPDGQAHPHRHASGDALDDADDVGRLAPRRHEVDQADRAVLGVELRLEDERVVPVGPARRRDRGCGGERPPTVLLVAEERREAGAGVEAREAEPVDAAVTRDERRRLEVADEAVVLDPLGHDGTLSRAVEDNPRVRALVQRVSRAAVRVDGQTAGACGRGLLVFLGVGHDDTAETAGRLAAKVARLRIFENDEGRFDRSLLDTAGGALVVSQFTLLADSKRQRGTRPSFTDAAPSEQAEPHRPGVRGSPARRGSPRRDGRLRSADGSRARERRPGDADPRDVDRGPTGNGPAVRPDPARLGHLGLVAIPCWSIAEPSARHSASVIRVSAR